MWGLMQLFEVVSLTRLINLKFVYFLIYLGKSFDHLDMIYSLFFSVTIYGNCETGDES